MLARLFFLYLYRSTLLCCRLSVILDSVLSFFLCRMIGGNVLAYSAYVQECSASCFVLDLFIVRFMRNQGFLLLGVHHWCRTVNIFPFVTLARAKGLNFEANLGLVQYVMMLFSRALNVYWMYLIVIKVRKVGG
jgi:hypothetical protein